jgi:large subunit ribosomal protein L24
MKKQFSKHWKASKQPRKQRKYRAKAPLHIKKNFLSANLKKSLREKYQRRSFPLRKGDVVRIMKGSFKKKTGKVEDVNLKRTKVSIEGIQRTKKDGTKVNVFFHPSNLQIKELNLDDKERMKSIGKKIRKGEKVKEEVKEKKPEEKKEKKKTEDKKENKEEKKK